LLKLRCVNARLQASRLTDEHVLRFERSCHGQTEIAKSPAATPPRSHDIIGAMRDEMDRVFERFQHGWARFPALFRRDGAITVPELDVRENTTAIVIEAELPGVDEKDVSVTLASGLLTIKGVKKHEKEEKGENYYISERSFGSFERSIRLPDMIDEASWRPSSTRAC
jgi:HSP20 family protein